MAMVIPQGSSGSAAGSSTRAPTARQHCRACRQSVAHAVAWECDTADGRAAEAAGDGGKEARGGGYCRRTWMRSGGGEVGGVVAVDVVHPSGLDLDPHGGSPWRSVAAQRQFTPKHGY